MQKKWLWVALAVAIVAFILVGGQALLNRSGKGTSGGGSAANGSLDASASSDTTTVIVNSATSATSTAAPAKKTSGAPQLALPGAKLVTMDGAPHNTVSAVKIGHVPTGARYLLVFRPYGLGPEIKGVPALVVRAVSSTPQGEPAGTERFENINMLLRVDPRAAGKITTGGEYSAIVVWTEDGDRLVPVVQAVKPG